MSIQFRKRILALARTIEAAHSIILTTHLGHDGDAIGSMLAVYHVLEKYGKQLRMVLNEPLSEQYAFLPGSDKIENLANAGIECDLLISFDCDCNSDRSGVSNMSINAGTRICIDHHQSNVCKNPFCMLDVNASATAEFLLELLMKLGIKISSEVATCLYAAITTDTGNFRFSNTSAKTMRLCAALIEMGVDVAYVNEELSVRDFMSIQVLSEALATMKQELPNVVSLTLDKALCKKAGGKTDNFINYARYIKGCEAALLFKASPDDAIVRVSLRFKNADAAAFAAFFGGGGHAKAAGFSVEGDLQSVRCVVLNKLSVFMQQAQCKG